MIFGARCGRRPAVGDIIPTKGGSPSEIVQLVQKGEFVHLLCANGETAVALLEEGEAL